MSTENNTTIRQFLEEDWPTLKYIRLLALQSDPGVFGSSHTKENAMTDTEWREWLTDGKTACFGVYAENEIIGMTGIALLHEDPTGKTAILWGSWLKPEWRGKGLSKLLYAPRIDWAQKHPTCEKIIVSHRASNTASEKSIKNHGFTLTDHKTKQWSDGTIEDQLFYELKL